MSFSTAAITAFNTSSAAASSSALAGGTLEFLTSGGVVLASASLGTPSAAGAVTTMGGFPKTVTASGTGSVASARYRTSAAADWKTGMTVGLSGSGAQVIMSALSVTTGQTLQVTSATLTHTGTAT